MTEPPPVRPGHDRMRPSRGAAGEAPLSVWTTAQRDARAQRAGRYPPAAIAHPGKMLPVIATTAITRYTRPGDLVADPMCGIGTTVIEAIHLGRDAIGVEYEPRWAAIAVDGIALAGSQGATGHGEIICGDARLLPGLAPERARGQAALVVTSPPYGPSVHGHVRALPGHVAKYDNTYGSDVANLARQDLASLLDGFTRILAGCARLLRPGGIAVVTARPWRQHGELVDFPAAVVEAGRAAGLVPVERCVALLAGVRGGQLIARPSFFQLDAVRKARARGRPWHLIVHEDVLVFASAARASSSELNSPHGEPGFAKTTPVRPATLTAAGSRRAA
jgi:modification methylase